MGDIDWASHSKMKRNCKVISRPLMKMRILIFRQKLKMRILIFGGQKSRCACVFINMTCWFFTKIKILIFAKKSTCWLSHLPRVYFGSSIPLSVAMCQPCPRWDPLDILDEIAEKRMHVLEGTKRGRAYRDMQQACENDESLRRPSTPDPHRVQSKRTWELSMFRWREEIRSVKSVQCSRVHWSVQPYIYV